MFVFIDALSAVLLVGLMAMQNIRRLTECLLVSVYSPQGTINVVHYLLGIVLYSSFSFTVLCESPDPADLGRYLYVSDMIKSELLGIGLSQFDLFKFLV